MTWRPSLGAWPEDGGTRFRVWAPQARAVEVIVDEEAKHPLQLERNGTWNVLVLGVQAGSLYRYHVDGQGPFPDPGSRFQPQGVHGPSEVVDTNRFPWSDANWTGRSLNELVIYELHVGTFTPAGTFAGVKKKLPHLASLGVTAIELMPIGDFAGQRNWGYDGVALFAPARCYGRPEELADLVDTAHRLGLAVILDVVYNHLGPEGNYLNAFSPFYFSEQHRTGWGPAINFSGENRADVRGFFIENALHWIHEYHMDGLRLDATHAIVDEGPRHFLAELATRVRESISGRKVLLIAEDARNLTRLIKEESEDGWGIDAVWADDFHHQVRRFLAGDHESYYRDYQGTTEDIATTIRQGWFYRGQHSIHHQKPRGTDPAGLPAERFVYCLQNHDQIGNRAFGERLHQQIELAAYRSALVLLLFSPATPLLFMGQEWAAGTPFLFFTDLDPRLGQKVTEGRRREFKNFSAFSDPQQQDQIPDPQALSTFLASKLNWEERQREPHASILRLHQALLKLRRTEPALRSIQRRNFAVEAISETTIILKRRPNAPGPSLVAIVNLRESANADLRGISWLEFEKAKSWETILTTEDASFSPEPHPSRIDLVEGRVELARPGAVILRAKDER
jgi:maltooligosyltrehalose trehalohydrolase